MKTKNPFRLFILSLGLFLGAAAAPAKSSESALILVTVPGKSHEIYSVSPDNQIKLYKILPGSVVESSMEGSTAPLLSPDGKKLAYLQGNNLFIKDLPDGTPIQVTKEGFTQIKKYLPVFPLISGWSMDSSKLVYYLKHAEEGEMGMEDGPALEPKKLNYGYYYFDTKKKTPPEFLTMEGYGFNGWSSKDEVLLMTLNSNILIGVWLEERSHEVAVQFEDSDSTSQLNPGPGDKALAVASSDSKKWSQVVEVDLATGKALAVSPQKGWADFNFPSYSPSGKKTAWIESEKDDDGVNIQYLVVDKATVLQLKTAPRYQWVDDGRIAVIQVDKAGKMELVVVDSSGGNTLARKGF